MTTEEAYTRLVHELPDLIERLRGEKLAARPVEGGTAWADDYGWALYLHRADDDNLHMRIEEDGEPIFSLQGYGPELQLTHNTLEPLTKHRLQRFVEEVLSR